MTKTIYAIFLALTVLLVFSCRKDKFNTSSDFQLEFSRDTILFDTVFTTLGSATQVFKVYNPDQNNSVEVDYFSLKNGSNSKFRINVDGEPGVRVENVTIAPEDSVFVFVEVTVDGNDEALPFVVEEELVVNSNGSEQEVKLIAWGQNAIFHTGSTINVNLDGDIEFNGYLECDEVWNNELPHVIFGTVGVPPGCCLMINAGTQIYVHSGGGILVNNGCIESNGQLGNEVVFQGDRLEAEYGDLPGQWGVELEIVADLGIGPEIVTLSRGGLWLSSPQPSYLEHTIIKNGIIGLQVDSTGELSGQTVALRNCQVYNHSAIGVLGQGATMTGYNNLFANCGQSAAAFQYGGEYIFDHCTFANYWSQGARQAPSFFLNNYYETSGNILVERSLGETRFRNCAFYGDNANQADYSELIVDVLDPEIEQYVFQNCLVDTEQDISDPLKFINLINQQNASFLDPSVYDFRPTQNSPLREEALPLGGALAIDLAGESRFTGSAPDIGCLQYVPD